jgi:hypothetical protein
MSGLFKICSCPYCPSTRGILAADVDAAGRLASETGERTWIQSDLALGDRGGVIIFNPDGHPSRPCAHSITLLLDVHYGRAEEDGEVERLLEYTGEFDNPWFVAHDPDHDYNIWLWEEILEGHEKSFHPVTPYRIKRPWRSRRAAPRGHVIRVSGTAVFAMDPDTFFQQLQEGYARQQAFYERHA